MNIQRKTGPLSEGGALEEAVLAHLGADRLVAGPSRVWMEGNACGLAAVLALLPFIGFSKFYDPRLGNFFCVIFFKIIFVVIFFNF